MKPTAADRKAEAIVDALEEHFGYGQREDWIRSMPWDHDEARQVIASHIPLPDAEREEELDAAIAEMGEDAPPPSERDTPIKRLRKALNAEGLSLACVLEAAIAKIEDKEQQPHA